MARDLRGKTPVELRAIARELGIEGADRMTGRIALDAIRRQQQEGDEMQSRFEVYEGADGLWYWRHVADNGEPLSRSSEGYVSKYNAERARDREVELVADEWQRDNVDSRQAGGLS